MSDQKPLHQIFQEMGYKPGEWVEAQDVEFDPEIVAKQRELLENIKVLLEGQVQQDLDLISQLGEEVNRNKFGGGK